ncbi:MAG: ATP-binding protein [Terriglobales bacterium]
MSTAYRELLEQHWANPTEESMSRAYQIGRDLMAANASLLELADLHHQALAEWLRSSDGPAALGTPTKIAAAGQIFRELIAGYEMLLRGYGEANAALRSVNERMEQRVEQIARALHDESGQLLAAVMIQLDQAVAVLPQQQQPGLLPVRQLLDQVEAQLRRLAHELHPALLSDLGLRPALEYLADGVSARSGLIIRLSGELPRRLPRAVELCLYRGVQEALNNVVRHALARNVRVHMQADAHSVEIRVSDDGHGFAAPGPQDVRTPRGMGLAGIRERLRGLGGELQILAHTGAGAELRLQVPDSNLGGTLAGTTAAGR